jgi:hypothetical protein
MSAGRLAGIGCVVAVLLLAVGRNWAQNNEISVQFHAFNDSRSVTVLTPTVDLGQDFTDRTNLRIGYGVDAISAASDSCARCHRDGAKNLRQVASLSVTRKLDSNVKFTLGGAYSQEKFYRATTGLMSISREMANANATVAGGFSFSLNQPVLHPNQQVENQYASDGYVSLTQTLTKTTIGQAGYELAKIAGYQDNPFLRADVGGTMIVGHVPDSRIRQTLTARIRQALPADTFVEADYRHYFDDWQLSSNAVTVGVTHRFTQSVAASFDYRRYDQTGAYFFQPSYLAPPPPYFTADFRLEPFASGLYTGRITMTPTGQRFGLPAGTGITVQYEHYRADNGFASAIFSAGLKIPLKPR